MNRYGLKKEKYVNYLKSILRFILYVKIRLEDTRSNLEITVRRQSEISGIISETPHKSIYTHTCTLKIIVAFVNFNPFVPKTPFL